MINEKLRIAVQLYGHLRTFEACAPYLRVNVLGHYDCDVFIHTWDRMECTTKNWHPRSLCNPVEVDKVVLEKVHSLYAPKSIKIESQGFFGEESWVKYMLYSQYQANLSREQYQEEQKLTYDYVLVTRPDIQPHVRLDFETYKHEFDYNKRCSIHLMRHSGIKMLGKEFVNFPYAADCFYFGKPEVVSDATRLYLFFDYYFKNNIVKLSRGGRIPEIAFFEHLNSKGILPRQYKFSFSIRRNDLKKKVELLPGRDNHYKAKKLIVWFVDNSPRCIMRLVKKILNVLVKISAYIAKIEK